MAVSRLFGRRIHISGSISDKAEIATADEVSKARAVLEALVAALVARGANFVTPIDDDKKRRVDLLPICFDWLVVEAIQKAKAARPPSTPGPLLIAVQHHKTELQIPADFAASWDGLRQSDDVQIENVAHWNMNSKRMEAQARYGDILITLGGGEGVLFLANLYHDAGKPIIPLNFALTAPETGARRLFTMGLSSSLAGQLFAPEKMSAHIWINRLNLTPRGTVADHVGVILGLLEDLEPPRAFVVRLLNPKHEKFAAVENYFQTTVKPLMEGEFGYKLCVVDGRQAYEYPRVDQEIFEKLHRSAVVIADITGTRPNCFIEMGYALGRRIPTLLLAEEGTAHPFDVATFAGHHWTLEMDAAERLKALRDHWTAVRTRPPVVSDTPLIT